MSKNQSQPTNPFHPPPLRQTLFVAAPFTLAASYYGWLRLLNAGAIPHLVSNCPAGSTILHRLIAGNISYFKLGFNPTIPPFLPGFISSFTTNAYLPIIESSRKASRLHVNDPLLIGVAGQLLGRGVVFPIWSAIFVSSGAARRDPEGARGSEIEQYRAEANLFAIMGGFVVPALVMWKTKSDQATLAWWFHPLTMAVLRPLYGYLRERISGPVPPSRLQKSREWAYHITLATYLIGFAYAAYCHITIMGGAVLRGTAHHLLGLNFDPSHKADATVSLAQNVFNVIQWDAWMVFIPSLISCLSFARSKTEAVKIALWDFVGTVLFGTGGTLNALWFWREVHLKKERESLSKSTPPHY